MPLPRQSRHSLPSGSVRPTVSGSIPSTASRPRRTSAPMSAPSAQRPARKRNPASVPPAPTTAGSASAPTSPPTGIAVCRTPRARPRSSAANHCITARPLAELTLEPAAPARPSSARREARLGAYAAPTRQPAQPARPTARAVRSQTERVDRPRAGRDDDALRLEVEIERLERELAPEARLLVAAERDPRERRVRHVDPDRARLDTGRDP